MRKKTTFAAVFAIAALILGLSAFVLPGCSSSDSTATNENLIQGTVTDADSGLKLEGVTVTSGDKSTTSDSSGYYKLEGFVGGRHIVKASKDGYGNYSAEVIVSSWQPAVHNIAMTVNSGETRVIGTVSDSTWNPVGVEGVTVTVGGKSATTDSNGKYEITGIEVKNMTLTASKTAYADYSADIDVEDGMTTTHNFVLPLAADAVIPFGSSATNFTTLFPSPTPTGTITPTPSPSNVPQVYLRNNYENITKPISLASPGILMPGQAYDPAVSANGRYVLFNYSHQSLGSFVRDRAFEDYSGVYIYDETTGAANCISKGTSGEEVNGYTSATPRKSISANGRYVVFVSEATNLVENDTNEKFDVFLYDQETQKISRISMAYNGDEANEDSKGAVISADGRYIAYYSQATNLVDGYSLSAFRDNIYVYDMLTKTTELVSVNTEGTPADSSSIHPSISADGRYVVFTSGATNLASASTSANTSTNMIYLRDRKSGTTELISVNSEGTAADGQCYLPSVTSDGVYVAYTSFGTNLVNESASVRNGYNHCYLYNRTTKEVVRVDQTSEGTPADSSCYFSFISADGSVIYFDSSASNLVDNDTNGNYDCFIKYLNTGTFKRFSISSDGEEGNQNSFQYYGI